LRAIRLFELSHGFVEPIQTRERAFFRAQLACKCGWVRIIGSDYSLDLAIEPVFQEAFGEAFE
jgi:hypothetical protein